MTTLVLARGRRKEASRLLERHYFKMGARRTLILIVAIAVGTVSALSAVLYLNSAQARADGNAKLIRVYKVTKRIPKNTTGDAAISANLIAVDAIPKRFYPPSAVTDLNAIKGKVAPLDLAPGQVLVDNEFVEPRVAQTSFSTTNVPSGEVAITVNIDQVRAVAGLVVPGDKVDLIGQFGNTKDTAGAAAAPSSGPYEHFFYQNVNVVAIGQSAAPKQGDTQGTTNPGSGMYTFAVPPEAAERIILASQSNDLYLALVPPDNPPTQIAPVKSADVDNPPSLTPYPSAGQSAG